MDARHRVLTVVTLLALLLTPFAYVPTPAAAGTVLVPTISTGGSGSAYMALNPVTNTIYVANYDSDNVTVIDGRDNSFSTIAVGDGPFMVAVNPNTNRIYVSNANSDNVTVIDGTTNTVLTTVSVGDEPQGIAVNPVTNTIYVANISGDTVSVIHGATNNVITTIDLAAEGASYPYHVAVNPEANLIFISCPSSGNVAVIDGTDNSVDTTPPAGMYPEGMAVNPVTGKTYVVNLGAPGTVDVLEGASVTPATTIILGSNDPRGAVVNPLTNQVYVAGADDKVTVINGTNNTTTTISADVGPSPDMSLNPVTNKVYITSSSTTVTVIDGTSKTASSVAIGFTPDAVIANPITNKIYAAADGQVAVIDGRDNHTTTLSRPNVGKVVVNPVTNKAYIAHYAGNLAMVLDGNSNTTSTISVGNVTANDLAVNPITNRTYVVGTDNTLYTIDGTSDTVIGSVALESVSYAMDVNPVTNRVYVANYDTDSVSVVDGASNSLVATVAVGSEPSVIAANPATNKIYVGNSLDNTVSVIDGNTSTVIATITVGNQIRAIAVNPTTNTIAVANYGSNTVTVIDGATDTVMTTISGLSSPAEIAVNPITNDVYVANQGSSDVTVINGNTFGTSTFNAGSSVSHLAVNPTTNHLYVSGGGYISVVDGITHTPNNVYPSDGWLAVNPVTDHAYVVGGSSITVITGTHQVDSPLVTGIDPLPGNQTTSTAPTFSFSASSRFSPYAPPIQQMYYQVDTWTGEWLKASPAGASASGTTPTLTPGVHTIYAFATDGQDATSINTLDGSGIVPGKISAYTFLVIGTWPAYDSYPEPGSTIFVGSVLVGSSIATTTMDIYETGNAALDVSSASIEGDTGGQFSIVSGGPPFSIADGATRQTMTIGCTPATVGFHTATLSMANNSKNIPEASYTLQCYGFSISDPISPTVTINQASTQADPVFSPGMVAYDVQFNQPVHDFSASDVLIGGTAQPTTATVTAISPTSYHVDVGGMQQVGTVVASIPADSVIGFDGHPNLASTSSDNRVSYIGYSLAITQTDGATNVTEGGDPDRYEVSLSNTPPATTTIHLITNGQTLISPTSLTFTPDTWNTPQTIEVIATDDAVVEEDHTGVVRHLVNIDGYENVLLAEVSAAITDNDSPGVTTRQTGTTNEVVEGGLTDYYQLSLTSRPTGLVTVTLTTDGQTIASPSTLTFSPITWNRAQTVRVLAVDDTDREGLHTSIISHQSLSDDPSYNGIALDTYAIDVVDNDQPGFLFIQTGSSTEVTEGGAGDRYSVALTYPPTSEVTMTIGSGGQALTFTPENWSTPQPVALNAQDDDLAEGYHTGHLIHRTSSSDSGYNGLERDLLFSVIDNDSPGVSLIESNGRSDVTEGGDPDSYQVVLTYPPTDVVTVEIGSDIQTLVYPGSLTFTPDNWDTPQSVNLVGTDDWMSEGEHVSLISHHVVGNDTDYAVLSVRDVVVSVSDSPVWEVAEQEPNNGADQPDQVNQSAPTSSWHAIIKGSIDSRTDIDWYSFDVKQPNSPIAVALTDLPADYDLVIGRLEPGEDGDTSNMDRGLVNIQETGRGNFSQGSFSQGSFSQGSFSQGSFSQGSFSQGSFSQGSFARNSFSQGSFSQGSFSQGSFSQGSFNGRLIQVEQQVQALGGNVLATSTNLGTQDETIVATLWEPGEYYLAVVNSNGDYSPIPYTVLVELYGSGLEPAETAPEVTLDTTQFAPDPDIKTLFVLNSNRMEERYPDQAAAVATIRQQVQTLAAMPEVNGAVIELEDIPLPDGTTWDTLYRQWDTQPYNPFLANHIARTVDHLITAATLTNPSDGSGSLEPPYPNVEYIVIVGSDSVIPFYRTPDLTTYSNQFEYFLTLAGMGILNPSSTLAGTLGFRTTLTDDLYGNDTPMSWPESPLYVPDRAVGRLVEKPAEIMGYLDQYTSGDALLVIDATTDDMGAVVTGYDLATDQAEAIRDVLQGMGFVNISSLISQVWSTYDLAQAWFDGRYTSFLSSPYTVQSSSPIQSINGHFLHYAAIPAQTDETGGDDYFYAADIITPTSGLLPTRYFENRLAYSVGCHSGLNVAQEDFLPDTDLIYAADFPQAFGTQGGSYVGNTGYGYGDTDLIAYGERLSLLYTTELGRTITENDTYVGQSIGMALVHAKHRYLANIVSMDTLDTKTLMQATLYGLPFLRVKVKEPVPIPNEDQPPGTKANKPPRSAFGVTERTITFNMRFHDEIPVPRTGRSYPALHTIEVSDSFIPSADYPPQPRVISSTIQGVPVLPHVAYDITALNSEGTKRLVVKDVSFAGAKTRMVTDYQPHITAVVTKEASTVLPTFPEGVGFWYPGTFYNYTSVGQSDNQRDQLLITPVQYSGENEDGTQGRARFYESLTLKITYVDPAAEEADAAHNDTTPPAIGSVQQVRNDKGLLQAGDTTIVAMLSESDTGLSPDDALTVSYTTDGQDWQTIPMELIQVSGDEQMWTATIEGVSPDEFSFVVVAQDQAGNVSYYDGKATYTAPETVPLEDLSITGPTTGTTNTDIHVASSLEPLNATEPLSYTWSPPPAAGQGTSSVTYRFAETGTYTVTVSAWDVSLKDTLQGQTPLVIDVQQAPTIIYLPLIAR